MNHLYSCQMLLQYGLLKLIFDIRFYWSLTIYIHGSLSIILDFQIAKHIARLIFINGGVNIITLKGKWLISAFPVIGNRLVLYLFVAAFRFSIIAAFHLRYIRTITYRNCFLMCFDNWSNGRVTRYNTHNSFLLCFQRIRISNHSFIIEFIISFQYCLKEPFKNGLSILISHVTYLHSDSCNFESQTNILDYFVLVVNFN